MRELPTNDGDRADILVVTALHKERKWAQKVFSSNWRDVEREGTIYQLAEYEVDGNVLTVAMVSQLQMGMPHAAILATKSLTLWKPSLVMMTGICAGVEGKVALGDVIIASKVFDYGSGKIEGGRLQPHFEPVLLDSWIWQLLEVFRHDESVRKSIYQEYPLTDGRPEELSAIHLGSLGCGAAVVADPSVVEGILSSERKLLGLDMESYAVALATNLSTTSTRRTEWLAIKCAVDFANTNKSDYFHEYGCYASAAFARKFVDRYYSSLISNNA